MPGPNVRFGSKADIAVSPTNVRFTPKSGHWDWPAQGLLQLASDLRMAIMELERYGSVSAARAKMAVAQPRNRKGLRSNYQALSISFRIAQPAPAAWRGSHRERMNDRPANADKA